MKGPFIPDQTELFLPALALEGQPRKHLPLSTILLLQGLPLLFPCIVLDQLFKGTVILEFPIGTEVFLSLVGLQEGLQHSFELFGGLLPHQEAQAVEN